MNSKQTIWVVDDDSSIRWILTRTLRTEGYQVKDFSDAETMLRALERERPDVMLTDIRMPGLSGLQLVQRLADAKHDFPCIIMTAHTDLDSALAAYASGAFEYLPKPFDLDDVSRLVTQALYKSQPQISSNGTQSEQEMIGAAPAMQDVFRAIGRLANSKMTVLINGESGTGKELVANALHRHSPRRTKPFIVLNVAAIQSELLASELFGHEQGAFAGATSQRIGRFEQAHGGTLFLDEVGEVSLDLQSRLLRVLSDNRFYRVGGKELVGVDVRVLAASNQNLKQKVADGTFREDLYHRLNVIQINVPTLRERVEDIPLLANRFLQVSAMELAVETKHFSTAALNVMKRYHWPGNVRQLENCCRHVTVMAPSKLAGVADLPGEIREHDESSLPGQWENALANSVRQQLHAGQTHLLNQLSPRFEAVLLRTALDYTGGHRQNAAKMLGWGRNTLTRKLKEMNIH